MTSKIFDGAVQSVIRDFKLIAECQKKISNLSTKCAPCQKKSREYIVKLKTAAEKRISTANPRVLKVARRIFARHS